MSFGTNNNLVSLETYTYQERSIPRNRWNSMEWDHTFLWH